MDKIVWLFAALSIITVVALIVGYHDKMQLMLGLREPTIYEIAKERLQFCSNIGDSMHRNCKLTEGQKAFLEGCRSLSER